jgi:cyclic beta-1,2-glucan synthetase
MNPFSVELAEPATPELQPVPVVLIDPQGDEVIRAEVLGWERLAALARDLARVCRLAPPRRASSLLLQQFRRNKQVLKEVQEALRAHGGQPVARTIDVEWLTDNFHIIDDSLHEVRKDLPPGYDEQLPKLTVPPLAGYPRVYALAVVLVAHTDSELDESRIVRFVHAFQEVAPLGIGELWAVPIMLRLVLLENLRRLAEKMLWVWTETQRAEECAQRLPSSSPARAGQQGENEPIMMPAGPTELSDPFVVRLRQLVRDHQPGPGGLDLLEAELARRGSDLNEVLRREHCRQAADQVTVGNCVLSLRLLSAIDWHSFFEHCSEVESILRQDPSGTYAQQDFATSDRYRRAVEAIARGSSADEVEVARRAIALAQAARNSEKPRDHVGYYLIDQGHVELKEAFRHRPAWRERLRDWVLGHPETVYFTAIVALVLLLMTLSIAAGFGAQAISWWAPLGCAVLLLPLSELAVGLINQLVTLFLPPRVLPKLDLKDGISRERTTFVVIPSMLVHPRSAHALLERLEIHYLASPDPDLRFALLTDFADAPQETMPEDEVLLSDALQRVQVLNERYSQGGQDIFFLFHRRRLWNSTQLCWMGWERKRGKLIEFNRLLRGASDTSYAVMSSRRARVPRARFVITLDADTQMPRDTAIRLIGALAHPLNQPGFDETEGRVVRGYGVLQPRVSFHLEASLHSRFAALLASSGGIDPYSSAASDVHMDLFGLGSFAGKGIYDVDAFTAATAATFPENQILSHDLIEGNYARCGLLSDTELFDDFPARYHAYAAREHRWVRGDWQLLSWLGRRVPAFSGYRANPLPRLERWKLLDNLRRSLVPPALLVLLVLAWTCLPGPLPLWTAIVLATLAVPLLQRVLSSLVGCVRTRSLSGLKSGRGSAASVLGQVLLEVVFLAHRAVLLLDAVGRTLVRSFLTRRKLLEWETAASMDHRLKDRLSHFVVSLWPAPALAVGIASAVMALRPAAFPAAAPFLVAWFFSPAVAWWISRTRSRAEVPLSADDRRILRRIARKTWQFYATFVGPEDHWLPPDNYQEVPEGRIAHRTSPTNCGMMLLSTLAAHDLGYISLATLFERLERAFDAFEQLEKHSGHLYNWFDTRTLQPLSPRYVSTVDSGNFLACLLVLKQGLLETVQEPLLGPEVVEGLADVAALFDSARGDECREFRDLFALPPTDLAQWRHWLGALENVAAGLVAASDNPTPPERQCSASDFWAARLLEGVNERSLELATVAPWLVAVRDGDPFEGGHWAKDEMSESWARFRAALLAPPSLSDIEGRTEGLLDQLEALEKRASPADATAIRALAADVRQGGGPALLGRLRRLVQRIDALAACMDFRPLYRPERHLFSIGLNLEHGRLDSACYDLLASEACLTSFLAVARGQAPRRHWFQLGRHFIRAAGRLGLISWGGSMFEYLMPRLLLRSLPGTLLAEAGQTAVARQMEYARGWGIPWGVSESAFAARTPDGNQQYQAFGVPGLGLKQGLEHDHVVAPYATVLAAMVRPHEALENLRRLLRAGIEGRFGLFEAIDYTRDRVPRGQQSVVVRSYMAHHQGMILLALANSLLDDVMPRRLHSLPIVRAAELFLQERPPHDPPIVETAPAPAPESTSMAIMPASIPMSRRLTTPATPAPRTHLLSNSDYHVMITNAGSGFSAFRGLDVTRWREDATRDAWGQFCYVRDLGSDLIWSAAFQPTCKPAEDYEVIFAEDKATFHRRDVNIETLMEVIISPEQPAEVRRITLTNRDSRPRDLEVTSYVEVVLAPHADDLAHQAFGKLFLETECVTGSSALLCRRRTRSTEEEPVWAVHALAMDLTAGSSTIGDVEYETDRRRFLGRGRDAASPAALDRGSILAGTTGAVLDPVLCLRRRVRLAPGSSAAYAFSTAIAGSRSEALALADQYCSMSAATRAFDLAWAHNQAAHRQRAQSGRNVHVFQRLASHLLFAGRTLRADPSTIAGNRLDQTALWRFGISGDRPIALAEFTSADTLGLARELLDAHRYLRFKGLKFDLVLLVNEPGSYHEALNQHLLELVKSTGGLEIEDQAGGVFVCKAVGMLESERTLLQAAARVVLPGNRGSLADQLDRAERRAPLGRPLEPVRAPIGWNDEAVCLPPGLLFPNGLGGFTPDGREYCLLVTSQPVPRADQDGRPVSQSSPRPRLAPAPWVNVIANPRFGFLVSESGSGFTWSGNSQTNRLTPWNNDPVSDPPAEVVYLRDDDTGEIWSPTPLPVPSIQATLIRHGQGYTTFQRNAHGLDHELTLMVPPDDPVKLICVRIRNQTQRHRHLSATYYAELVLGQTRDRSAMHVVTEIDAETGGLLARSAFRGDFAGRVAFADVNRRPRALTADRLEFLGRHGSVAAPGALTRLELSGTVGAALDPCAALQVGFDLKPGAETLIVFLLGETDDIDAARGLIRRYRETERPAETLLNVQARWNSLLETVQVQTPDAAFDLLFNRWLLYQVLSCRVWARTAFYQSAGAYGFRDQLQDVMALVEAAPEEARAHILRAAGRQFLEGDVQHWWHPPAGKGVRTRIADDPLWLPFVTHHYVTATGDASILDEPVSYLEGPSLKYDQKDDYGLPGIGAERSLLYEHCLRALERAKNVGSRGLPLIGHGDWNDGMNRLGIRGKGESVWLAWFAIACFTRFAELADARRDGGRASTLRDCAETLRKAIEEHAWDGAWYCRAFFDDGTALGSAQNHACSIDSIAQSWAVLSGAGERARALRAMEAVEQHLVRRQDGLILLLTPPFDDDALDPGYVKGYLPGIRENGGQYTHAAAWVIQAFALLGQGDRAYDLLRLVNPIRHTSDAQGVERYQAEPYVVAGDVYSHPCHVGRAGWTWYTGAAGWLYRVMLESILGLRRSHSDGTRGDRLWLTPRVPTEWDRLEVTYRFRSAVYRIQIKISGQPGPAVVHVDGRRQPDACVHLIDDGKTHKVQVAFQQPSTQPSEPHDVGPGVNECGAAPSSGDG